MEYKCFFAGFGGQGIISMGTLLTYAGMLAGKQVLFFPSYAVTMRGGSAHCTVIVSDDRIASPVVDHPEFAIAMNPTALDVIEKRAAKGALILVNQGMIERQIERSDLRPVYLHSLEVAQQHGGDGRMANMAMIGALLRRTSMVELHHVRDAMEKAFPPKLHALIPQNFEVLKAGYSLAE